MATKTATYQFKMMDPRRTYLVLLTFLPAFSGMIIGSFALRINISVVIILSVTIFLGAIYGFARWVWRPETITLYTDRLMSDLYGEIYLDDIIRVSSPWYVSKPALKIHTRNKRTAQWGMNTNSRAIIYNTAEETAHFLYFVDDLQQRLAKQPQHVSQTKNGIPLPGKTTATAPVAEQLKNISTSFKKPSALIIPIGLVFGALILVRSCAGSWFHRNDIKKLKTASEQMYVRNMQWVEAAVAERLKTEGHAFLYTNDHAATIKLFPDIKMENPLNIALFKYTQANQEMEDFLAHKDSAKLELFIISGDSSIRRMSPGITGYPDSSEQQFFLRTYDPAQHIKPANLLQDDTTGQEAFPVFDITWGVNLKDTSNIAEAINSSIPGMNIMLSQIRLRNTFLFYMAGKAKNGMDEDRFKQAVSALNKLLHANKVDTTTFVSKTFN